MKIWTVANRQPYCLYFTWRIYVLIYDLLLHFFISALASFHSIEEIILVYIINSGLILKGLLLFAFPKINV